MAVNGTLDFYPHIVSARIFSRTLGKAGRVKQLLQFRVAMIKSFSR